MNKYKLLIWFLAFGCHFNPGYHVKSMTGIYIVSKVNNVKCTHKKGLLNTGIYYCLEDDPIIDLNDFEELSEIELNTAIGERFFDIVLSSKASNDLQSLNSRLNSVQLGIVVNNQLVTILNLSEYQNANTLRIWEIQTHREIKWIHKAIQDQIINRSL